MFYLVVTYNAAPAATTAAAPPTNSLATAVMNGHDGRTPATPTPSTGAEVPGTLIRPLPLAHGPSRRRRPISNGGPVHWPPPHSLNSAQIPPPKRRCHAPPTSRASSRRAATYDCDTSPLTTDTGTPSPSLTKSTAQVLRPRAPKAAPDVPSIRLKEPHPALSYRAYRAPRLPRFPSAATRCNAAAPVPTAPSAQEWPKQSC